MIYLQHNHNDKRKRKNKQNHIRNKEWIVICKLQIREMNKKETNTQKNGKQNQTSQIKSKQNQGKKWIQNYFIFFENKTKKNSCLFVYYCYYLQRCFRFVKKNITTKKNCNTRVKYTVNIYIQICVLKQNYNKMV